MESSIHWLVPPITGWWFGTFGFYDFPETVGNGKSSQLLLTPWFLRGVG
jgi:hypothetical protein